jgi:transcriptional regulator with XRE-family HTH domain
MLNRRRLSGEEAQKIGLRIKACRSLTGLNQEEFANRHGFALPSVKTWERGVVPRLEGIQKIIEALETEGIFVRMDWLLYGFGTGPAYSLEAINNVNDHSPEQGGYAQIFNESCQKSGKNPLLVTIMDNEMSPWYNPRDLLAGFLIELAPGLPLENPLLVKLNTGVYAPRWVQMIEGHFYARSIKNPQLVKLVYSSFGEISWHKIHQ